MSQAASSKDKALFLFRLPRQLKAKLSELSKVTGRSQPLLCEEALESFCDVQAWQIEAIQQGLQESEAGLITPHESVKRYWESRLADCLD